VTVELDAASVQERLQRYREMADDAARRAEVAHDSVIRQEFVRLAAGWRALAAQIEKASKPS
jgi:hypothetical protein